MSAIFGTFAVPGGTVDRESFTRGFSALAHHGRYGRPVAEGSWWSLGRQIHEADPTWGERIGRAPSPMGGQGAIWVAHDGYLDNRAEVCRELDLPRTGLPDARVLVRAYQTWGPGMFERLVGPMALVVVDVRRRRIVAGRDALGDRSLVYGRAADGALALATEEEALLAAGIGSEDVDETAVAHFLAVRPLPPGRTFFRELRAIPAGHHLVWEGAGGPVVTRHWHPPARCGDDPRSAAEWVDEARYRFRQAVRCRIPDPDGVTVLMSGGLDSTAIAAEAAELRAEKLDLRGDGSGLHAISWVFDEPASDERPWIDAMTEALGLRSTRIAGDALWPLSPGSPWPVDPCQPAQTVYRRLLEATYARAREAGTPVLLSGDHADQLFVGSAAWLAELLAAGRWATAGLLGLKELVTPRGHGLGFRAALGRLRCSDTRSAPPPPWLTSDAAGLLEPAPAGPPALRPDQLEAITAGWAVPYENPVAARAGVELRRPWRDRRLVELFLRMPAHVLYRPGWPKWLTRQMTKGRLPEPVRRRRFRSTMLPIAQRGLVERELITVRSWLGRPDALWRGFVRRDWLDASFPADLAAGRDGVFSLVAWNCLCLELWSDRRAAGEAAA